MTTYHWDWINPEEALEILKKHFIQKEEELKSLRKKLHEFDIEIEKDTRIQKLKEENNFLRKNVSFMIEPNELEKIQTWKKEHDTNVHNNPKQYHGTIGGGYSYIFYPTGIGTCITVKCNNCGEEFTIRDGSDF